MGDDGVAIEVFSSIIDEICLGFRDRYQVTEIRLIANKILESIRIGKAHEPKQIMDIVTRWLVGLRTRDVYKGSKAMFNNEESEILLKSFHKLASQAELFSYLLEPHLYMCVDARSYKSLNSPANPEALSQSTPVPPPPSLPSPKERALVCMELIDVRVEELGDELIEDGAVSELCVRDEILRTRIERYVDTVTE